MLTKKLALSFITPALLFTTAVGQRDSELLSDADWKPQDADAVPAVRILECEDKLCFAIDAHEDFYYMLLAADNADVDEAVGTLQDAFVVASGRSDNCRVWLELPRADALEDAFIQPVLLLDGRIRVAPAMPLGGAREEQQTQTEPALQEEREERKEEQRPGDAIECLIMIAESQPPQYFLAAYYEARSDGFALRLADVRRTAGTTDVYIVLKTPGPGEGRLDVTESHQLLVPLGTEAGLVRVHIAERAGTEAEEREGNPADDEWRLHCELGSIATAK